jgi:hypothetical protein
MVAVRRELRGAAAAVAMALTVAACRTTSVPAPWTPPPSPPAGWSATASMPAPRSGDLAVTLADGRVLLVGGNDGSGQPLGDSLWYDPAAGTWTATASAPAAIYRASAVLLEGGEVLVVGDTDAGEPRTELWEPATGAWTETTGPAVTAGAALAALADGKALLCGGIDDQGQAIATAELFDPVGLRWATAASMDAARSGATAARLADGRVLVVGGAGIGPEPNALASAELFDPATGQWAAAAPMQARRPDPSAALLPDGRVLVGSGITILADRWRPGAVELYDPATNAWTMVGDVSTGLHEPAMTMSANQVLFVGPGGAGELFDVRSGRTTPVPPPYGLTDGNVFGPAVGSLGAGRILLAGGTLMRSGGHGLFVGTAINSETIGAAYVYDCRCAPTR